MMTTKINRLFCTVLLTTFLALTANAQNNESAAQLTAIRQPVSSPVLVTETANKVTVPDNLMQNFNRSFKQVGEINWTLSGDNYFGSFTSEGKKHMVVFDKQGSFVYAKINCKAEDLNKPIQQQLTKNFSSFTVFDAIEIKTPDGTSYQVVLQNAKQYADLRFTGKGELLTKKIMDRLDAQ